MHLTCYVHLLLLVANLNKFNWSILITIFQSTLLILYIEHGIKMPETTITSFYNKSYEYLLGLIGYWVCCARLC